MNQNTTSTPNTSAQDLIWAAIRELDALVNDPDSRLIDVIGNLPKVANDPVLSDTTAKLDEVMKRTAAIRGAPFAIRSIESQACRTLQSCIKAVETEQTTLNGAVAGVLTKLGEAARSPWLAETAIDYAATLHDFLRQEVTPAALKSAKAELIDLLEVLQDEQIDHMGFLSRG